MWRFLPQQPLCPVCGDPTTNPATLGLRFAVDEETGAVEAGVTFSPEHMGYAGRVHGGLLAMVLDEAMAWACAFRAKSFCTTGELKLKLKGPVPPNTALTVRAWVDQMRGPYLRARGELRWGDGHLLVAAVGSFAAMPREESLALRSYLRFAPGDFDVVAGVPYVLEPPA